MKPSGADGERRACLPGSATEIPASTSLRRFAASLGKADRYHETITWAFLLLIRERMARAGNGMDWAEFAAANDDLLSWEQSVLKKYYREETLASDLARVTFVLPDRLA